MIMDKLKETVNIFIKKIDFKLPTNPTELIKNCNLNN